MDIYVVTAFDEVINQYHIPMRSYADIGDQSYSILKSWLKEANNSNSLFKFVVSNKRLSVLKLHANFGFRHLDLLNGYRSIVRCLFEHCQQISSLLLNGFFVDDTLMILSSCPSLTQLIIFDYALGEDNSSSVSLPSKPLLHCANIVSLSLDQISSDVIHPDILDIILACRNLKSLRSQGRWIYPAAQEIFTHCTKLEDMDISLPDFNSLEHPSKFGDLIETMARDAVNIKKLAVDVNGYDRDILQNPSVYTSFAKIVNRLRHFSYQTWSLDEADHACTNIYSLFGDQTNKHLESLHISTDRNDAEMISIMLQRCPNLRKLTCEGYADMSLVMKLTASCHELLDLTLSYVGQLDGAAMKCLLNSCPMLEILDLSAVYRMDAYESLALHGNNLVELCLFSRQPIVRQPRSFADESSLFDQTKIPTRRKLMKAIEIGTNDLDAKSLALFLSFFGRIRQLKLNIISTMMDETSDLHNFGIPSFTAEYISCSFPSFGDETAPCDRAFFSIMGACRDMTILELVRSEKQVNGGTLAMFVYKYIVVEGRKLRALKYSGSSRIDLSALRMLLPQLKLVNISEDWEYD
jgi:hypothetical protein